MIVPVMGIRKMFMHMRQCFMTMLQIMIGLARFVMLMWVMIIMGVFMLMLFRLM